jgi:aryl-alcohol dehydrogenase-like predicted oxidoreductase
MVIATKYTTIFPAPATRPRQASNHTGNSTKSLRLSVEASLKKLQTDYIDLLYVHWWDWTTSVPEVMQSLNQLVLSGKVLYLGISDTPAWIVSKANECKLFPYPLPIPLPLTLPPSSYHAFSCR